MINSECVLTTNNLPLLFSYFLFLLLRKHLIILKNDKFTQCIISWKLKGYLTYTYLTDDLINKVRFGQIWVAQVGYGFPEDIQVGVK